MNINTIILASILLLGNSHANDTTVSVAAGGIITPKKEPDIKMKKEILTISPKNIHVEYEFLNTAKTKTVTVAFPLPKAPYVLGEMYPYASWDEAQFAYRTVYGDMDNDHASLKSQLDDAPLIDFTFKVNDQEYHPTTCSMRAYDQQGNDITNILKQHNIPLSSAYLRGFEEQPPIDKFPGLKDKLKSLNLVDKDGYPNWQLQTTYLREQTFEKGKLTKVTHSYTPYAGSYWVDPQSFENPIENNELKIKYHGSKFIIMGLNNASYDKQHFDRFMKIWKKVKPENNSRRLSEVQYILSTGANWNGPIESFTLEIKPNSLNDLVIIKGRHPFTRNKDGTILIHYSNYTPTEELTIWFVR